MRRRDEVLVGLFTTVAIVILALASIWLVRGGLSRGYPLHSVFSWGAGVKQGAPVWLVGVTIGTVDKVELDPRGLLRVTYRVQSQYSVPRGSTAAIVPNGLFGDQAIALTPEAPNEVSYAPGDTIPVGDATASIQSVLQRADTLTTDIGLIMTSLRSQLVDSGGIAEIRRTTATLNRLLANMSDIAQTQSRELQSTLVAARSRLAAVDSAVIDSTMRSLQQSVTSMEVFTRELSVATDRFNRILAQVDSGPGTMTQLLRDTTLYRDLRRVVGHVDSLLLVFMANPRRFIKFSIF
jgi:phospholipid/cholesterol/gamma-HCH transport system substrate-binding protein